jgi:competence protein ComEA
MRIRFIIEAMGHRTIVSAACSTAIVLFTVTGSSQNRFPDGPGKAEVLKVCSGCHEPDNVFAYAQTAAEWAETLERMAQAGAEGTAEEWRLIELYLDANLALIPINNAASGELQRTMELTKAVADAVVKHRGDNGRFKTIDDLKKVPGLDAAKVDVRKDRFVF